VEITVREASFLKKKPWDRYRGTKIFDRWATEKYS